LASYLVHRAPSTPRRGSVHAGALFGLAVSGTGEALCFVDDSENQLNVLH